MVFKREQNSKENGESYSEGVMCGQKVVDRKTTEEQIDMLRLKETIDQLTTTNGVRWYGHVLRRDDDSVLRVALDLEVSGQRKQGRLKKTWKKQVEEEAEKRRMP